MHKYCRQTIFAKGFDYGADFKVSPDFTTIYRKALLALRFPYVGCNANNKAVRSCETKTEAIKVFGVEDL